MDIDKTINPHYKSYTDVQNLSSHFFQLKTRFLKPDLFSFAPPLRKLNRKMNF